MRSIRMLGLAVVAAMVAMAMVGAGNASAAISLCKVANETPCATANQYSLPFVIEGSLKEKTEAVLKAGFSEIKCRKASSKGTATGTAKTAGGVEQIVGKVEEVKWEECTSFGGLTKCTATALQLPWTSHLNQKTNGEQNNGDGYSGEGEAGKSGQPGAELACGTTVCIYKVKETQPEEVGAWGRGQLLGGNPAEGIANQAELKKVEPSSSGCAETAFGTATSVITRPNPVYLTH